MGSSDIYRKWKYILRVEIYKENREIRGIKTYTESENIYKEGRHI